MWKRGCFTANVGERLNGIQAVSGSIPLISAKSKAATFDVLIDAFAYGSCELRLPRAGDLMLG